MMNAGVLFCGVCNKAFTGAASYEQHMVSQKHFKKQQMMDECPLGDLLKCEPCQKVFTGIVPYEAHMASAGHAKRAAKAPKALAAGDALPSTSTDQAATSEGGTKGGCMSCGIPSFESSEAMSKHYESEEHRSHNKLLAADQTRVAADETAKATELPPSVFVCRAEEDFEEFCKKHGLFD